ncbi:hypothetical protein AGABI2DRAFT_150079 [Agaricus bisporus var. bisporus H97]|uniref:hypothetical protein n=1 Tax=Agaricus bisporus var. bisporus (strain H97 / ATCC MYA-4626 / FGSC 10389) TaxID=936046 RepID=UPI00029F597D|nr:hypothetical protein AGABI2DRAFT_150079 [Agaricus bisporus var. bisporus H97]EKV48251.1 hypothetical protein AGABI2DRAFT_150079 [Agaricus bisporus var. bisporus H97]
MSAINPNKLVEEFKKSGEFERIRRELFAQFQGSGGLSEFKSRVENVARQRLTNDHNLLYMPQEFIHRELMQELDKSQIVEGSTSELPMLSDSALSARINLSLEKILKDQGITVKANAPEPTKHQDPPSELVLPGNGGDEKKTRCHSPKEAVTQAQASGGSGIRSSAAEISNGGESSAPTSGHTEKTGQGADPNSMDVDDG